MSTRSYSAPQQVITNGDMSDDITSMVTVLEQKTVASYQFSWAGTSPVGTVSIQVSNNYSLYPNGTVNNTGTWTTLTLNVDGSPVTTVDISGNAGDTLIDPIGPTAGYAIRAIYTSGSGVGTLQAFACFKVT